MSRYGDAHIPKWLPRHRTPAPGIYSFKYRVGDWRRPYMYICTYGLEHFERSGKIPLPGRVRISFRRGLVQDIRKIHTSTYVHM